LPVNIHARADDCNIINGCVGALLDKNNVDIQELWVQPLALQLQRPYALAAESSQLEKQYFKCQRP